MPKYGRWLTLQKEANAPSRQGAWIARVTNYYSFDNFVNVVEYVEEFRACNEQNSLTELGRISRFRCKRKKRRYFTIQIMLLMDLALFHIWIARVESRLLRRLIFTCGPSVSLYGLHDGMRWSDETCRKTKPPLGQGKVSWCLAMLQFYPNWRDQKEYEFLCLTENLVIDEAKWQSCSNWLGHKTWFGFVRYIQCPRHWSYIGLKDQNANIDAEEISGCLTKENLEARSWMITWKKELVHSYRRNMTM